VAASGQPTVLDDLAADLLAAADADADDVADRLHDGPVQALVFARYAADAAVRGADVTVVRDAVQAALVELRRALWHLRPRTDVEGGLPAALALLSGRLEEAGRPALGLCIDETVTADLSPSFVSTAYRLTQEVVLPEGSEPVTLTLRRDDGFDVLELSGGAPLTRSERWAVTARALGGTLTGSSGPPPTFCFAVPHPAAAKARS
jgi:signal transduction histidine kinase